LNSGIIILAVDVKNWFRAKRSLRTPDDSPLRSAPPCQISRLSGQKCGTIQAPKLSKFRILAINLCLRGDSFAIGLFFNEIFSVCTRLHVAFRPKFLVWSLSGDKQPSYKDFSTVGAFFLKFSIAPSGETTDRIKKSWGSAKMARNYGPPLSPCQLWWKSLVGCRQKSVIFLSVFLWRFGMTKVVITETLWFSVINNTS